MSRTAPPAEPPRVGLMLAQLRHARGLSLDELSRQAGVSKSMLSQIERNQANPTVAVVWRLANALGVALSELLASGEAPAAPSITAVPAHAVPLMRSPDGQCELRILGPIDLAGQFEWYELRLLPGGVLSSQPHEPGSREHLSVLSGEVEVSAGEERHTLRADETARYAVDQPHALRNPGTSEARALLVVLHPA